MDTFTKYRKENKTRQQIVYLTETQFEYLKAEAAEQGINRSDFLIGLMEAWGQARAEKAEEARQREEEKKREIESELDTIRNRIYGEAQCDTK